MAKAEGPLSGFRDMLAEQVIPRQQMEENIKKVYESYGFVPLDTPAIEKLETLTGKYGEEGEKLIYKFQDNGGRDIALRYDLTVPLARVVAQHRDRITFPYKRYQIGKVWRGESPQKGRYREFEQFDADIVGANSSLADAEIVAMMSDAMQVLGAQAQIRVNNRLILDGLVKHVGIDEDKAGTFIGEIDSIDKKGQAQVLRNIHDLFGNNAVETVDVYLNLQGNNLDRLKSLDKLFPKNSDVHDGIDNLLQVFSIISSAGYDEDAVRFDQTIARGLDYYTGVIYETTLKERPNFGSVCSGGRFDRLVQKLGGPNLPAVGTSIGVDRLFAALQDLNLVEQTQTKTQVLITNFTGIDVGEYMKLATRLRKAGIPTEVAYESGKSVGNQLKSGSEKGIRYALIMGQNEVESGKVTVRNLATREQEIVPIHEVLQLIQKI